MFATFLKDEEGAVAVDWVVLTAMIVGLSLLVVATVRDAAVDPATGLGARLTDSAKPTFGI